MSSIPEYATKSSNTLLNGEATPAQTGSLLITSPIAQTQLQDFIAFIQQDPEWERQLSPLLEDPANDESQAPRDATPSYKNPDDSPLVFTIDYILEQSSTPDWQQLLQQRITTLEAQFRKYGPPTTMSSPAQHEETKPAVPAITAHETEDAHQKQGPRPETSNDDPATSSPGESLDEGLLSPDPSSTPFSHPDFQEHVTSFSDRGMAPKKVRKAYR